MSKTSTEESPLKDFLALSRILTGVEKLDREIGRQYLDRLMGTPFGPPLRLVLARFRGLEENGGDLAGQVRKHILGDDTLRPTLCQIILLWYTSAMPGNPDDAKSFRFGTDEAYFSGLSWQLMGAHVPGLSGGYFGHWRYRPDNEPLEGDRET